MRDVNHWRTVVAGLMLASIAAMMLNAVSPDRAALSQQLRDAARKGDMRRLEYAIQRGADVNDRDEVGVTPLFEAVRSGRSLAAERLILAGADVDARARKVGTPLLAAASFNEPDCARVLLAHGAFVEAADDDGHSAFDLSSSPEMFSLLTCAKNTAGRD